MHLGNEKDCGTKKLDIRANGGTTVCRAKENDERQAYQPDRTRLLRRPKKNTRPASALNRSTRVANTRFISPTSTPTHVPVRSCWRSHFPRYTASIHGSLLLRRSFAWRLSLARMPIVSYRSRRRTQPASVSDCGLRPRQNADLIFHGLIHPGTGNRR